MTPTVKIETVTPKKAQEWLEGNVDNRKLRESRVLYLARMLQDGEWDLSGDAIVFDDQGVLLNGQHRLTAVVIANVPARFLILRGVPARTQEVMDQNLSRSVADQLHRRGIKYPTFVSSALYSLAQIEYNEETGNVHYTDQSMRPTLRELLTLFEKNSEIAEEVTKVGKLVYYTKVRHGATTAIYHRLRAVDPEETDLFFERWQEGTELAKNDPIWKLREWCINDARTARTSGRAPTYRFLAVTFKAWNYWRDGIQIGQLTWHFTPTRREAWPIPH